MFTKSLDHQISFTADIEERGGSPFLCGSSSLPSLILIVVFSHALIGYNNTSILIMHNYAFPVVHITTLVSICFS